LGLEPRAQGEQPGSPQPVNANGARARLMIPAPPPIPSHLRRRLCGQAPTPAGPRGSRPPPHTAPPHPQSPEACTVAPGRSRAAGSPGAKRPLPGGVWYLLLGQSPSWSGSQRQGFGAGQGGGGGRVGRPSLPPLCLAHATSRSRSRSGSPVPARGPVRRRLLATALCSADSGRGAVAVERGPSASPRRPPGHWRALVTRLGCCCRRGDPGAAGDVTCSSPRPRPRP
jgi:hypothetical protein